MNEIITYGQNYSLNKGITNFIKSAVKTGNRVVIIGYNLQEDVLNYINSSGCVFVDAKVIAKKYNVDITLSPYTLKVIFFYLYCNKISKADNVFLCDFTDVYFNKDIFNFTTSKPTVFGEIVYIRNCQTNTTWINLCYNQDIYGLLQNYEIINGGAILGPRTECVELLKEMCLETSNILGKVGNYPNIDQAILNKVVRFDQFRYEVGPKTAVLNLAQVKEQNKWNKHNVPAVFHQYDGHVDVENFINEQS
jgi:hypothetical protein